VTSKTGISDLFVDGPDLYWTTPTTSNNVALMTMPVAGGTPRAIGVGHDIGPLAFDASNIYWVTLNDGTLNGAVVKVRRADDSSVTLATGLYTDGASALGVNSRGLYWNGETAPDRMTGSVTPGIFTMPLDGGTPQLVPDSERCGRLAFADETNLYCTSEKVPLDGSAPTQLATPAQSNSTAIIGAAFGASHLYLVTYGCRLLKVPVDGQPVVTLATLPTPAGFETDSGCGGPLVVDAHNAYIADDYDGAVMKVALDGSGMVTTLATFNRIDGIALNATSVYVANVDKDNESELIKVTPK
jgi:hypothetical protein